MNITDLKVAAFLDDAGDDLDNAVKTLKKHNLSYVVIQNVWPSNICNIHDNICAKIRSVLISNNISVIAIFSDIGYDKSTNLANIKPDKVSRAISIAKYYNSQYLSFGIGIEQKELTDLSHVNKWMNYIADRCHDDNLTPLFELRADLPVYTPLSIIKLIKDNIKWRVFYDPVNMIIKSNNNPYVKYWSLLKQYTAMVGVRDYKIGHGFKPIGYGDSKIKETVSDMINSSHNGWLVFKTSLGRKYGTTKSAVFSDAINDFDSFLQDNWNDNEHQLNNS